MLFGFLATGEMIMLLLAITILFGATRIPQLGDALGKGIHNFRKSVSGHDDESAAISEKKDSPETKNQDVSS